MTDLPRGDPLSIPRISRFLQFGFTKYSRRLIAKRFSALRVAKAHLPQISDDYPLIVFGNHASWWDPLVAVLLHDRYFDGRTFHAPIDAAALKRYSILGKLGFFPVEQRTAAGSRQFLEHVNALLNRTQVAIYITPQGRFVDVRDRQPFDPGLAHVTARVEQAILMPMAIEYTFWNESRPEILVEFGEPIMLDGQQSPAQSKADWNDALQNWLHRAQEDLAMKGIARDPQPFETIVTGRVGEGGMYDWTRRIQAWLRGHKFDPAHGSITTSQDRSTQ